MKKMMQQAAAKMLQHALSQLADFVELSCFSDPLAEKNEKTDG